MVEPKRFGENLHQGAITLVGYLSRLVESPEIFEELVGAWQETDSDRFHRALGRIPLPDDAGPYEAVCFLVCKLVEVPVGLTLRQVCRWTSSGEEVGDDELEAMRNAPVGDTGKTLFDVLVSRGLLACANELEVTGWAQGKKCDYMCLDKRPPMPPGPGPFT